MSNDEPPKLSLKERIAALNQKASEQQAAPQRAPPTIPKSSASWAWKQKQAQAAAAGEASSSPPPAASSSTPVTDDATPRDEERAGRKPPGGSMNASDAKAVAGSLKERMAALQGKGAFGPGSGDVRGSSKPAVGEKPRVWKKPAAVPTTAPAEEQAAAPAPTESGAKDEPSSVQSVSETSSSVKQEDTSSTGETAPEEPEEDAEEQAERERRAAIAVRMARLGGARVGMAPAVLGRKPAVATPSPEAKKEESAPAETEESRDAPPSRKSSILSPAPSEPPADTPTVAATVPLPLPTPSEPLPPPVQTSVATEDPTAPASADVASPSTAAAESVPLPEPSSTTADPISSLDAKGESTVPVQAPAPDPLPESSSPSPAVSKPLQVPRRALPPRKKSSRKLKEEAKEEEVPALPDHAVTPAAESSVADVGDDKPEEKESQEASIAPKLQNPDLLLEASQDPHTDKALETASLFSVVSPPQPVSAEHDNITVRDISKLSPIAASIPIHPTEPTSAHDDAAPEPTQTQVDLEHDSNTASANDVDQEASTQNPVVVEDRAPSPSPATDSSSLIPSPKPEPAIETHPKLDTGGVSPLEHQASPAKVDEVTPESPVIHSPAEVPRPSIEDEVLPIAVKPPPSTIPTEPSVTPEEADEQEESPSFTEVPRQIIEDEVLPITTKPAAPLPPTSEIHNDSVPSPTFVEPAIVPTTTSVEPTTIEDDDEEQAERERRQRLADRMAKLGGVGMFAAPSAPARKPSIPLSPTEKASAIRELVETPTSPTLAGGVNDEPLLPPVRTASTSSAVPGPVANDEDLDEEEEERARRRRLAERMAKMGGVGMFGVSAPQPARQASVSSAKEVEEVSTAPEVPLKHEAEALVESSEPAAPPLSEEPLDKPESEPTPAEQEPPTELPWLTEKITSPPLASPAPPALQEDSDTEEQEDDWDAPSAPVVQAAANPPPVDDQPESHRHDHLATPPPAPQGPRPPVPSTVRRSLPPPPVEQAPTPLEEPAEEHIPTSPTRAVPPSPAGPRPAPSTSRRSLPPPPPVSVPVDVVTPQPIGVEGEVDPDVLTEAVAEPVSPPPVPAGRPQARRSLPPPPPPQEELKPVADVLPTEEAPELPVDKPSRKTTLSPPPISVARPAEYEHEVMDDSDTDPIDPSFYSPPRSKPTSPRLDAPGSFPLAISNESTPPSEEPVNEEETRKQSIAERMAKLGGVKFGVPGMPPPRRAPPPPAEESETVQTPDVQPTDEGGEETEEQARARRARIAARMAGMGQLGMIPGMSAPAAPQHTPATVEDVESVPDSSAATSDDGVQVEPSEISELEDVGDQAESWTEPTAEEVPPPLPAGRPTRPPVPSGIQGRSDHPTHAPPPPPSRPVPAPQTSDFVIIDEPQVQEEEEAPPPPPRPTAHVRRSLPPAPHAPPPPPPPLAAPQAAPADGNQWELPAIPRSSLHLGDSDTHSDDDTEYPVNPPPAATFAQPTPPTPSAPRPPPSGEDLMSLWGRYGTQVLAIAEDLVDQSKKSVIGDGSSAGFVSTVFSQIAGVSPPPSQGGGHVVFHQNGASVNKRLSDIMPGDVIEFNDAKFKAHKTLGIGAPAVHVGMGGESLWGVIHEFEPKKGKVKVWHAGTVAANHYPTVENVSYRLEDLKSGAVKIYRVAEA